MASAGSSLLQGSAFITGGASGIGKATALCFAKHGIKKISLADADVTALNVAKGELQEAFPDIQVLALEMDVRDASSVVDGLAKTAADFGRLDIAVNAAGIGGKPNGTHETPEEDWFRVVDINLHGVWRCEKEELKIMVQQEDLGARQGGRGTIINVSSALGLVSLSDFMPMAPYIASKHGVLGLTKADACTYGPMNIRINAICPGWIETAMTAKGLEGGENAFLAPEIRKTPLKRNGQPEEIAESIAYMASPMASFMQGTGMVVDGGYTICM